MDVDLSDPPSHLLLLPPSHASHSSSTPFQLKEAMEGQEESSPVLSNLPNPLHDSITSSNDALPFHPPLQPRVPLSHRRRHNVEALAHRTGHLSSPEHPHSSSDLSTSHSFFHLPPSSSNPRDIPFTYRRRAKLGKEAQKKEFKSSIDPSQPHSQLSLHIPANGQNPTSSTLTTQTLETNSAMTGQEGKEEATNNDLPPSEWTTRWWTSTPLSQMRRTNRSSKSPARRVESSTEGQRRPPSVGPSHGSSSKPSTNSNSMDLDIPTSESARGGAERRNEPVVEQEAHNGGSNSQAAIAPSNDGLSKYEALYDVLKESVRRVIEEKKLSEDVLQSLRRMMDQLVFTVNGSRDGQKEKMNKLKTKVSSALLEKVRLEMVNKMTETTQHCFESLEDVKAALINQILADEEQVQLELEKMDVEINGLAQPLQMLQALTASAVVAPTGPPSLSSAVPMMRGENFMAVDVPVGAVVPVAASKASTALPMPAALTSLPPATYAPTVHIPAFNHPTPGQQEAVVDAAAANLLLLEKQFSAGADELAVVASASASPPTAPSSTSAVGVLPADVVTNPSVRIGAPSPSVSPTKLPPPSQHPHVLPLYPTARTGASPSSSHPHHHQPPQDDDDDEDVNTPIPMSFSF